MTVEQLIEHLKTFEPSAEVWYECAFAEEVYAAKVVGVKEKMLIGSRIMRDIYYDYDQRARLGAPDVRVVLLINDDLL